MFGRFAHRLAERFGVAPSLRRKLAPAQPARRDRGRRSPDALLLRKNRRPKPMASLEEEDGGGSCACSNKRLNPSHSNCASGCRRPDPLLMVKRTCSALPRSRKAPDRGSRTGGRLADRLPRIKGRREFRAPAAITSPAADVLVVRNPTVGRVLVHGVRELTREAGQ